MKIREFQLFSTRIPPDMKVRIDVAANSAGVSSQRIARYLLELGLQEFNSQIDEDLKMAVWAARTHDEALLMQPYEVPEGSSLSQAREEAERENQTRVNELHDRDESEE